MFKEGATINRLKCCLISGFVIASNFLFSVGCSDTNQTALIEERNGLIFIQGKDQPFTGNVVDTLAKRIIEYQVVDGKKNGDFQISSLEGKVEMEGKIKNNLNEGLWRYYYPNGQLESIGNFENNLSEGKWTWYFENGKIKEIGYFKSGKKEGSWIIYDEKGNVKRKAGFKEGQIIFNQEYDKELFS
jgi:antitoxin component YwqK of YwqJK toxin-antitoxin module